MRSKLESIKKLLNTSIIACLIFSLSLTFNPKVYSVVMDEPSDWAQKEIDEAKAFDLVIEEADHSYQSFISRQLFCELVVNMVEKRLVETVEITISNPFTDTDDVAVIKAYQLGIVNGKSITLFGPDELITREQIAAMMVRAAKKMDVLTNKVLTNSINTDKFTFNDSRDISGWALQEVKEANALGLLNGVGENELGPKGYATVEQSIALILRLHNANKDAAIGYLLADINMAPVSKAIPPVGFLDFYMHEQATITITPDQIAIDPDGDPLTIVSAVTTNSGMYAYGVVTLNASGGVDYIAGDLVNNMHVVREPILAMVSDGTVEIPVEFSLIIESDTDSLSITHQVSNIEFDFSKKETMSITVDDIMNQGLATDPRAILGQDTLELSEVFSTEYGRIFPETGGQRFIYEPDVTMTTDLIDLVIVTFRIKNSLQNDYNYFDVPVYMHISAN